MFYRSYNKNKTAINDKAQRTKKKNVNQNVIMGAIRLNNKFFTKLLPPNQSSA